MVRLSFLWPAIQRSRGLSTIQHVTVCRIWWRRHLLFAYICIL